jgi:hypothetical protein
LAGPQLCAQGTRVPAGAMDRPGFVKAANNGNLSQHCRMGTQRRVWRRGRRPARVRQIGPKPILL